MTRTRPPHEDDRDEPCPAQPGETGPAREIDPLGIDDEAPAAPSGRPKSMPAPGTPLSVEEYERLKEQAESARIDDDAPAQEDG